MTTSYYYNNTIPNSGFNQYNTGNSLYYYTIGNSQDNLGVIQSKYSTVSVQKQKSQYYNPYAFEGNNIRLKASPNIVPIANSNAYSIVNERSNINQYLYPNNYQQRLSNTKNVANYFYNLETIPKYETKTEVMNFPNFNSYGIKVSPQITIQRSTSPITPIQRMNSGNSNSPKTMENIRNNVNIYSPVMSPSITYNDHNNDETINNNNQLINNEKFENEKNLFNNNNTDIIAEDNDYARKKQEINDAFSNTNFQISNNKRPTDKQLASSVNFPSQFLTMKKNDENPSNYHQSNDNNNQIINNNMRYSVPQKINPEYQLAQFSSPIKKKENISQYFSPQKGIENLSKFILPRKGLLKINGEIMNDNSLKEFYREMKGGIVESYAYYEDSNSGYRNYMEDKAKSIENLKGDQNKILFCLFDGHGGGEVSNYLQNYFGQYMKQIIPFKNLLLDFKNLFKSIDEKVKLLNASGAGSTATIAYIERQNGKRILYVANIGDTRCVLVQKNGVRRMTYDDRVDDKREYDRIIKQGGIIFNERIYGQLMLSRCFGDWNIKEYGVIVEPHISRTQLSEGDSYLIIASDGVWDVINDEECLRLTQSNSNTLQICKNIVVESLNRGSQDNISCFVIKLN